MTACLILSRYDHRSHKMDMYLVGYVHLSVCPIGIVVIVVVVAVLVVVVVIVYII